MTPIVLAHGVGLDRQMWQPFTAALGRPTIAYDLLGLGDGPRPVGPYTLAQYARQLLGVVDECGAGPADHGRVDVVGFSMGALVAQRFAADHPDRVRRLVLVSGVYDRTPAERAGILRRVAEVRDGGYLATIEPALQRWFTAPFAAAHPDVVDQVRRRMLANDVSTYAWAYEVFATGDEELVPLTARITAPTLVITGADDPRSTPQMAQDLAAALPDGRAVVLAGLRHLLPLEAPEVLANLVGEFTAVPTGVTT